VDGFIASAAFLVAYRLNPRVRDYAFFSHRSAEKGHARFFRSLGLTPLLDLGLRLGEGTGAVLALPLLKAALRAHAEMATFQQARVPTRIKTRGPR
jgi:nicotinate-nucleotide--dimethylbenzimidazole phosphoribosyltransferase